MRAEANRIAPDRSKASDGTIGDARHQLSTSDHNPRPPGDPPLVRALDLTNDPAHGWDAHARVEQIRLRRDPRVKYLISNRRIAGPGTKAGGWDWHPYTGANAHDKHAHTSVTDAGSLDTSPWWPEIRVQTAGTATQGDYVKPQPPPPPVQLPGGKMRQLVAIGPLDSSGRGWVQTGIPFDGFEAVTVNAVNPEQSGYGNPVVVHAMNWNEKIRLVVMDGKPGSSVGVYVTTAT
jgi:hypothetical protein